MIAAFWPPGPEPMTARSKSYVCSIAQACQRIETTARCVRGASCSWKLCGVGASRLPREAAECLDGHLPISGLPHVGHGRLQESPIARGDQARIEYGDHSPVAEAADEP